MERMVQVHTHIFEKEETLVIVKSRGEKFDWTKFFFFEAHGDEYVISAMPDIDEYWILRPHEKWKEAR